MSKLTRISSLQETKSLASHPLRKNPQSLVSKKMKMKEKKKTEQGSVYSIFIYLYLYIVGLHDSILHDALRTSSRELYIKKITKQKYMRLFTPFPNLIAKESYNWWLIRRIWGFRQQKSEEKYPKVSVATIGKLQENTRALCKMAAKSFRSRAKFFL